MSIQVQTGIITGATSGIGEGVARELNAAGMKLILTGRRTSRLVSLSAELGNCAVVAGDLNDIDMPQKLIEAAVNEFGSCDFVFNSAGIMHVGTIEEADIDALCRMVRVNVETATRMAYTALRHFKKAGKGHLMNVSSILGTKVRPNAGVYAGSKHSIEALTEALRMEVAKTDIQVSMIEPGVVETELQNHFPVHPKELLGITTPLQPADIARCVRFMLEQPPHVRIPVMMILPGEQPM